MNNTKVDKGLVKDTIHMAWPAVLESVSISIAGLIDTLMVSSISTEAVAAVGLTTQPKFLGLSFFIAINVAISALVARRKGEGKKEDANRILLTAVLLTILAGIIVSVVCVWFANPIIHFSGSEEVTHADAVGYFRIIMGCIMFSVISLVINAAQRGAGNTKIAMTTNLVSNGMNIVFNYLLIKGNFGFPALGIRGAALATVIGTVVAFLMSIRSLFHGDFLDIRELISCCGTISKEAFMSIIKISYSVFLEQILLRIGFMSVAIMAAKQGSKALAVHQVAMNVMSLSFAFGDGMQSATVSLIGQSLGQKDVNRAKLYRKTSQNIGSVIAIVLAIVYLLFGRMFYELYFSEQELVNLGVHIMFLIVFIVLFQVKQVINMGCLRGAGDVLFTTCVSTICVTIIRPSASYLLSYQCGLGLIGIWIGILIDQVGRLLLTALRCRTDKWTRIKI